MVNDLMENGCINKKNDCWIKVNYYNVWFHLK